MLRWPCHSTIFRSERMDSGLWTLDTRQSPHAFDPAQTNPVLTAARRSIVVKMGTQLLTNAHGQIDLAFLCQIAGQVAQLRQRQFQVTIVSSGAIGAGCAELGLKERPRDVADQQAVAAVGQRRLMTHLHEAFEPHDLKVGQLLLTRSDFDDRVRFLNIRNCVTRLHQRGRARGE